AFLGRNRFLRGGLSLSRTCSFLSGGQTRFLCHRFHSTNSENKDNGLETRPTGPRNPSTTTAATPAGSRRRVCRCGLLRPSRTGVGSRHISGRRPFGGLPAASCQRGCRDRLRHL